SLEDIPSLKRSKYKCFYSLESKLEEKKGLKLKMPRNQQRIQSQFKDIRRENTHNNATREPRVNRRNEEGLDHGSGGTGNTSHRCKLDFPRYDGSIDLLPWMSHCDYYFRHQRVTDEEKISMVAPHLEDDAQYWFLKLDTDRPHMVWDGFKDHCRQRFGFYGSCSKLGELVKLRQTGYVEEYQ
ncbi:hypothetical protein Tco_0834217, partial [Tanacetum coccineum]